MSGGKKGGGTSQITGYKYFMAVHHGLCRGPVNELTAIKAGDRDTWDGSVTATDDIDINLPELFGGDTKEGGIVGTAHVLMGDAAQTIPSIIRDNIEGGFDLPSWRGVLSIFYYGQIGSNNPYPKAWKFRVNRQTAGWDNDDPWYSEKALIEIESSPLVVLTIDSLPHDGDTLIVGSHAIEFVNSDADSNQVVIGADVDETATNLTNHLNFYSATYDDAAATASGSEVDITFATSVDVAEGSGDFVTIVSQGGTIKAMNGAHIIYECATNNVWGRGLPAALIDDDAFRAAADTLFDEHYGLCLRWNREDDIDKFVQLVVDHIGAAVYIDRQTGLLTMKLIRNDYDADTLIEFDFTNGLLDVQDDESSSADNLFNEVVIKFTDPITGKQGQVREQNLASFQALGTTISKSVEYKGCPTATLAHRLALRDLRMNSGDLRRLKIKLNRNGISINPGDPFKINVPTRGIEHMILRAGEVEDATLTDGTITVSAVQDVFFFPATTYRVPQPSYWSPAKNKPRVISKRLITELTYYDLSESVPTAELATIAEDTGFLKIFAANPKGGAIEYAVDTEAAGETAFVIRSIAGFDETATLPSSIGYYTTDITIDPETSLSAVAVGQPVLVDDEYCRVDAIDAGAGTMTIARGCIDTIPAPHTSGARIWFQTNAPTTDFRDYATSEDVSVKLLTRTSSGMLDESLATTDIITIGGRQGRPYPPGDMEVNGTPFGDDPLIAPDDVVLTWAHRDRIVEGNNLLEHGASSTGPEPGTTYTIRVYGEDEVTVLRTVTGLTGDTWTYDTTMATADGDPTFFWIEVESVRDSLVSWQHYRFLVSRPTGFDEGFDYNFDGGF